MASPNLSAAAITSSIVHRAARLDHGGRAGCGYSLKAVRKGKNASDAATQPQRQRGLHGAEPCSVHAAHLPCADAEGLPLAGVNDGVGLDVLADAPGKEQAPQLLGRRRTPGDDLQFRFGDAGRVGVLQQQPARNVLDHRSRGRGGTSTSRRFFLAANRSRASVVNAGAAMASTKTFTISSAASASTSRLMPMTPPNAETGSQASAFWYASSTVAPVAAPQGLVCFTMITTGSSNSCASSQQASRSTRLLKLSSLPWSWRAPATPRPVPSA